MTRTLQVSIDERTVGTLSENQGIWSFQYDSSWTSDGYPLSPKLALSGTAIEDTGTDRPVQWFFDNLLPEETARASLFASLPAKGGDAWDLLAQFGAESAGAITLLPPGAVQADAGLQPLPDDELDARIKAMPRIPLAAKAPKKMSLAGAQQKLPVVVDDQGKLFDPVGAYVSTHILKPDVLSEHYPSSAVNEWFCLRVAHEVGLPVPAVLLRYVPAPVYLIARFDREMRDGVVRRLHTLDAAQLLSLSAGAKYARSGVDALIDVIDKCRVKANARLAVFRWSVFNALIGNADAHLKNLSLFASKSGYAIAPHYDLVSTAAWSRPELAGAGEATWPHIELSFPIGSSRSFDTLSVADVIAFGEALGVTKTLASQELKRLVEAIVPAAEKILAEHESRTDVPLAMRASQLKMLRAIIYLPIRSMCNQLKQ